MIVETSRERQNRLARERYQRNIVHARKSKVKAMAILRDSGWWANYRLKYLYNLTTERFNEMITEQGNRCGLCAREFNSELKPHVDHCHSTGIVRRILCKKCNSGLGFFRDDPAMLRQAADYLERYL